MNRRSDRIIGVLLLLFAIWYGYTALNLRTTLLTDPIGPKFFPLFLATLMGLLSFYLLFKPDPDPEWPSRDEWVRIVLITLTFIGYAYLMNPLGFIIATTLEMIALSLIFRGPLWPAVLSSFVFTLALYGLFEIALDLSLPTGQLIKMIGLG